MQRPPAPVSPESPTRTPQRSAIVSSRETAKVRSDPTPGGHSSYLNRSSSLGRAEGSLGPCWAAGCPAVRRASRSHKLLLKTSTAVAI